MPEQLAESGVSSSETFVSIVDVVQKLHAAQPDKPVLRFLPDGDPAHEIVWDYMRLTTRAKAVAAAIGSTNRLIRGLITGVIFSVILVIIPILAYPDSISWSKIIRIVAVSTCGGLIGGIVNLGKSNKKFHKGRKKRI